MMDDKDRDEAKKLCKRLDWMKINGKNDLVQWENVLSYEIARIRAEARDDERRRCAEIIRHVECVNGNETEIRRADAIAAILQGTEPAPDFDAIAREIEEKAYQSGTFFPALCAQILRKHFGKED
ncbi:MAG: hypothetical protein WC554_10450 [Clostridia bacterium]